MCGSLPGSCTLFHCSVANITLAALLQFCDKSSYLTRLEIKGVVTTGAFVCHSVTKLCLTLCDPMDCSTPGFPVHHQLLELVQTHVLCVDATQLSLLLLPPTPLALNHSQHQGLFQWVGSLHQVTKVLQLQLQHQSFWWTFRVDFL